MTDVRITGSPIGVYEYLSYDDLAEIVRPWDPRTIDVAGTVAALIESQMPDAHVEHVGSTAIPGCTGKGIVDLQLVILDLGLPDTTGQDLLRRWRAGGNDVPVLILSSRTDEAGIVEALELGADDYLTKPFGVKELVARIRNALRHRLQAQGERALFQSGDLTVDLVRRIVRLGGEAISLSPREYEVLRVLVQHAGKVLTHQFLIREVWGGAVDVQNLRVLVRQLRHKIEPDPERPRYILTETGVGYRLRMPD